MAWADNSNNEDGFEVERSTDGRVFSRIGVTTGNVTEFRDTEIKPGKRYWYRIRAYNTYGRSGYTKPASVQLSIEPPSPAKVVDTVREAAGGGKGDSVKKPSGATAGSGKQENQKDQKEFTIEKSITFKGAMGKNGRGFFSLTLTSNAAVFFGSSKGQLFSAVSRDLELNPDGSFLFSDRVLGKVSGLVDDSGVSGTLEKHKLDFDGS